MAARRRGRGLVRSGHGGRSDQGRAGAEVAGRAPSSSARVTGRPSRQRGRGPRTAQGAGFRGRRGWGSPHRGGSGTARTRRSVSRLARRQANCAPPSFEPSPIPHTDRRPSCHLARHPPVSRNVPFPSLVACPTTRCELFRWAAKGGRFRSRLTVFGRSRLQNREPRTENRQRPHLAAVGRIEPTTGGFDARI